MGIIKKLNNLLNLFRKKKASLDNHPTNNANFSSQPIYQAYDFSANEVRSLVLDMLKPVRKLIKDIDIDFYSSEQLIYAKVGLKSFLQPFSFEATMKIADIWQDAWTSTAVLKLKDIKVSLVSYFPKSFENWCGKKVISIIGFLGSILQKKHIAKNAHFYLQDQLLYIDFKPWLQHYLDFCENDCNNELKQIDQTHWLSSLFSKEGRYKGKRYLKNHIIFGGEISEDKPCLRIYMYRIPASLYKNDEVQKVIATNKSSLIGNWFEWSFAILTSFLLVSFLVPFGMEYVKLQPLYANNVFSLSSIIIYNTFLVLIPLFMFRVVLMPMRRIWQTRHGNIEILQAEVSRDQFFLPLLRKWIILLQTNENTALPTKLLLEIRSFLVAIGKQKYLLVDKIALIEKRRQIYFNFIIVGYLGVCILELLLLTQVLPTPKFLVSKINIILENILLK